MEFDLPDFLQTVVMLVAIMDPVGNSAAAISLTVDQSEAQRRRTFQVAGLSVLVLLATFFLLGEWALDWLGLQTSDFLLGTGILLIIVSLGMLTGRGSMAKEDPGSVAIVPIATPLLVGPGALSMVILVHSENSFFEGGAAVLAAALVVAGVLLAAEPIQRLLGEKGGKVVSKIMAVIVVGYAGSFIHRALMEWGVASK
jgi:multiple antibiotic resistance protein